MKITSIKQQVKNENRVSIYVDDKYSFSLSLDQLLEEKLKKGIEIDQTRLRHLKNQSEEGKVKNRALEWVLKRPHSEKELRDYLYRKNVEADLSQSIIDEFKSKNYINDESFARWFAEIRLRKNKSRREIESELKSKGISPVTIQNIVTEIGIQKKDKENLALLINKLRVKPRYSDEQKLTRYLLSKGFAYTDIKNSLEED